jgi:hypothetical protein
MHRPPPFVAGRHRSGRHGRRSSRHRRAAIVLELVLTLPILLILVLALVQFGLFYANMQHVALASRVGAEEASQTVALPTTDGEPVPENVRDAIARQLQSVGLQSCQVRLEHNVAGTQVALVSATSEACACEPGDNLTAPLPPGQFVRLRVSVPLADMMPNCLAVFGFNVCDPCKVAESTTIFRYELQP